MTRRKSLCVKWTLVLVLTVFCQFVLSRPQELDTSVNFSADSSQNDLSTEPTRFETTKKHLTTQSPATENNSSRDVKTKTPIIGESMQVVANQLLQNPNNTSVKAVVADTRIPPRVKNQVKQKVKTRLEDAEEVTEIFHAGEAVPVTMEELETENKVSDSMSETSTSNEGISTWILLSNTGSNVTTPTEPTKAEEPPKKKPNPNKNKNKKPPNNKNAPKRPIIGSTNKADLVASGSAINENVYNKLKDTVLSNVQKNKSTPTQKTTTSTTPAPTTEEPTTKKTPSTKTPKPQKKKNKNKPKSTTTIAPEANESALLPMEAKEQEIELEVSTPPITTKKPKRSSTKKINKTKKRKTTKPKLDDDTSVSVSEIKTSNKTKTVKHSKKPATNTSAISTQIYNYLSREVMPSVGVGVLGLASLVGIASYFFYPFATPVRRTLDVDKKDDIYMHNAEEYGNEGNGQAEEEMLGTVLAGMPAHAKQKLNPYAGQTAHVNRYPAKKEENIRYRHVTPSSYMPNYNARYPQQKTGIAHGAVYPEPMNYNPYSYETRHVQTTEAKYSYDKVTNSPYTPAPAYSAVEPIYAAPQTGPSGSSFGNDAASSVVYGIKPSSDSDFKPVYPYEGQFYNSETTSNPNTYPSTSMYLGSNNENERHDGKYEEDPSGMDEEGIDNKFVVGNVPKELSDSATPAVVPEHGPRKLSRKKRGIIAQERSIANSIDDILKTVNREKDVYISNEIDDIPRHPSMNLVQSPDKTANVEAKPTLEPTTPEKIEIVESVSTLPIDKVNEKTTEDTQIETTTKSFKVYEVFPDDSKSSSIIADDDKVQTTTTLKNMNTETTTEVFKSETTSTLPPSPTTSDPISSTKRPFSTLKPEVLTYPPIQDFGFFGSFLRRLVEFKYKLGLSILQTTSDSLNRYLRNMEKSVAKASKNL